MSYQKIYLFFAYYDELNVTTHLTNNFLLYTLSFDKGILQELKERNLGEKIKLKLWLLSYNYEAPKLTQICNLYFSK